MAFTLLDAVVKIALDDQASSKLDTVKSKIGTGLATAAKVGIAAVSAAGTAVVALATKSIEAYADYEQLVGGVETLFKDSADAVVANAQQAFSTAGMSANDYMETVTSFSSSLLQSLGGDTESAVSYADRAITDMSDNANKMGTDISAIQNAYQGFAKQNYTMLDNLKLGYGGTQSEMERLIADAAEMTDVQEQLGITVDASSMSFANIVNAISVMQTSMGIAGTTSKEAMHTISGSLNSMKAAWTNLITGMADDTQDFGALVDNLVTTLVGDGSENSGVIAQIIPRVQKAIEGIGKLIEEAGPVIASLLPEIVAEIIPALSAGMTSLVSALESSFPMIVQTILSIAPDIVMCGFELIMALANALLDNLDMVIDTAIEIILTLAEGLIDALPKLIEKVPVIIEKFVSAIIEHLPEIVLAAVQMIIALQKGIIQALPNLLKAYENIAETFKETIANLAKSALNWGKDIIQNFIDGIKAKFSALKSTVSNIASTVKNFIGFSEPKEGPLSNFHTYAPDMMALFAKGIKDNEDLITDQIGKSFDFSSSLSAPALTSGTAAASAGSVINIYPQSMSEAEIDYLVNKLNVRMGAMLA